LFSCEQDDNDFIKNIDIVSEKWKIVKLKSCEDVPYSYTSENYIFEFVNDTVYNINLDVNQCSGKYKLFLNEEIEIEMAGCTKMCCDSEFAQNLISLLSQMKQYSENNNELILTGNGTIVLEKF